jgi:hypothetical protein
MRYAIGLLAAVLIYRSYAPTPTAKEIEQRDLRQARELNQTQALAEQFPEEILGPNVQPDHGRELSF